MKYVFRAICFTLLVQSAIAQNFILNGCLLDSVKYDAVPITAPLSRGDYDKLPGSVTLKHYAPRPGNQGEYGTCTAWATAYGARTIAAARKQGWTVETATARVYSPSFVYNQIRYVPGCDAGTVISDALSIIQKQGVPELRDFPYQCDRKVTSVDRVRAAFYRIQGYKRLFAYNDRNSVRNVKKALASGRPVIVGMMIDQRFMNANGVWSPSGYYAGGHAMVAVGYDDSMYGGAVELLNSWGSDWGNDGYIWVRYRDFTRYCREAYELADFEPPVPPKPQPIKRDTIVPPKPPVPKPQPVRRDTIVPPKPPVPKPQPVKRDTIVPPPPPAPPIVADTVIIPVPPVPEPVVRDTIVPAPPPPVPTVTLQGAVALVSDNGTVMPLALIGRDYQTRTASKSGDMFQLKVTIGMPAFVYVFNVDNTGRFSWLFPHKEDISPWLGYANSTIILPDEDHLIQLDATPGEEHLCILFSTAEIPRDMLAEKLMSGKGTLLERLKDTFGDRVMNPMEMSMDTSTGSMSFKITVLEEKMVPLLIKLSHH